VSSTGLSGKVNLSCSRRRGTSACMQYLPVLRGSTKACLEARHETQATATVGPLHTGAHNCPFPSFLNLSVATSDSRRALDHVTHICAHILACNRITLGPPSSLRPLCGPHLESLPLSSPVAGKGEGEGEQSGSATQSHKKQRKERPVPTAFRADTAAFRAVLIARTPARTQKLTFSSRRRRAEPIAALLYWVSNFVMPLSPQPSFRNCSDASICSCIVLRCEMFRVRTCVGVAEHQYVRKQSAQAYRSQIHTFRHAHTSE
jgi:hypothetical protein